MEMQLSRIRELTLQEKRAARMWAEGVDIDGEPAVTKAEIARRCGMTHQQLSLLFKRQEFLDEVDKNLGALRIASGRELLRNVPKAVSRLVDIVENGQDREALAAASKILAIAGFSDHNILDVNVNDSAGVVRGGFGRSDEVLPDAIVVDAVVVDADGDDG